mgnify:CR=1 FL=1
MKNAVSACNLLNSLKLGFMPNPLVKCQNIFGMLYAYVEKRGFLFSPFKVIETYMIK